MNRKWKCFDPIMVVVLLGVLLAGCGYTGPDKETETPPDRGNSTTPADTPAGKLWGLSGYSLQITLPWRPDVVDYNAVHELWEEYYFAGTPAAPPRPAVPATTAARRTEIRIALRAWILNNRLLLDTIVRRAALTEQPVENLYVGNRGVYRHAHGRRHRNRNPFDPPVVDRWRTTWRLCRQRHGDRCQR